MRASRGFGLSTPEHEDDKGRLGLDETEDGLGERLPAELRVAHRFAGTHGEDGIEQQDALVCPRFEVAGGGRAPVGEAACEGGVDGLERGGRADSRRHGEGQPVGVARRGVGILAEDDDLHVGGVDEFQRAEDVFAGGEHVA